MIVCENNKYHSPGATRISFILLLGSLLIILVGLISCSPQQISEEKTTSIHKEVEKDQTVNPRLIWSLDTGSWISTSPAFDKGMVYFTNDAGYLYALNAKDGSIKWTYRTSTFGTPSTPVVGEHAIFFGNNDEHLYAIDKETGRELWQYKTYSQKSSTPLYYQGKVYIGRFDFRRYVEPKETAFMMAVNAQTGQEVWRYSGVTGDPQIFNDKLYCGFLSMLNPENGKLIQHIKLFDFVDHVKFGPTIKEDMMFLATYDHSLCAFDPFNMKILWTFPTAYSIVAPPVLEEKTLYVITEYGMLYALEASSGKEVWKVDNGDRFSQNFTARPVVYQDTIFLCSSSGVLFALDKQDGTKKWTYHASSKGIQSTPFIDNNHLYFADLAGVIYALDIAN
jgi:eukaryotic-like serine/threonine-protein kinase